MRHEEDTAGYLKALDELIEGKRSHLSVDSTSAKIAAKIDVLEDERLRIIRRAEQRRQRERAKLARQIGAHAASGGIDPVTKRPFRGSGVPTCTAAIRSLIGLSRRFSRLGLTQEAEQMAGQAIWLRRAVLPRLIKDLEASRAEAARLAKEYKDKGLL